MLRWVRNETAFEACPSFANFQMKNVTFCIKRFLGARGEGENVSTGLASPFSQAEIVGTSEDRAITSVPEELDIISKRWDILIQLITTVGYLTLKKYL